MRKRFLSLAFLTLLGGCASPPSFRNFVYEQVSNSARVVEPAGTFSFRHNQYRYPPGAVLASAGTEAANHAKKTAGLIGEPTACTQRVFTIKQAQRVEPTKRKVSFTYDVGLMLSSPFTKQAAIETFLKSPELLDIPDNTIAFIKEVRYDISNMRVFEAKREQLGKAVASLRLDRDCTVASAPFGSLVVRRIYTGNVRVSIRWDNGATAAIGSSAKGRVQDSLRYRYEGTHRTFAVEADSLSFF